MNIQLESIKELFCDRESYLKSFKKDSYEEAFTRFGADYSQVLQMLVVHIADETTCEQNTKEICDLIIKAAGSFVEAASSKSKKEETQMQLNMFMATYVLPTFMENHNDNCKQFAEELCNAWGKAFKNSNIKASDFQKIQTGFRSKLCYITTAVCESLDKPVDCYELNLLKSYRDSYLMDSSDGEALIHEYYDIAPTIIKRINKEVNSKTTYKTIWNEYLKPCISFIEDGKNEECKQLYTDMVFQLRDQYMEVKKKS